MHVHMRDGLSSSGAILYCDVEAPSQDGVFGVRMSGFALLRFSSFGVYCCCCRGVSMGGGSRGREVDCCEGALSELDGCEEVA